MQLLKSQDEESYGFYALHFNAMRFVYLHFLLIPIVDLVVLKLKLGQCLKCKMTRGPRGPWVAHLRKRSMVIEEPIIENPRDTI